MSKALRTHAAGVEMIKRHEGFTARAQKLPDGRWMIGYGHVETAREGVRITPDDAEALLIHDLRNIEQQISSWILSPLNDNKFSAVISFVYSVTPARFEHSNVLRLINAGDHAGAATAMEAWRLGEIGGERMVVDGLVRRRAAEKALFLAHPDGEAAVASRIVTPQCDETFPGGGRVHNEAPQDMSEPSEALSLDAPATPALHEPVEVLADSLSDRIDQALKPRRRSSLDDQEAAELRARINRILSPAPVQRDVVAKSKASPTHSVAAPEDVIDLAPPASSPAVIDDLEVMDMPPESEWALDDRMARDKAGDHLLSDGRRVWLLACLTGLCLAIVGGVLYGQQIWSGGQVTMVIGALLSLMSAYFMFAAPEPEAA